MEQDQQLLDDFHKWDEQHDYLKLVGEDKGHYLWGYWCGGILFVIMETYDATS